MTVVAQQEADSGWSELGFAPGLVLRAFGMRRAGNHAMLNWLTRNAPGGAVFLNNCTLRKSPFDSYASLEVNGERRSLRRRAPLSSVTAQAGDGAMLVISYEDHMPGPADAGRALTLGIDEARVDRELILYRNFMNWSASLLKKLQGNARYGFTSRMRVMINALDKYRQGLELASDPQLSKVLPVCYDSWLASETYRARVLGRLELPLRDNSLGDVQSYGGGSSFQKDAAAPDQLATSERWQLMVPSPDYQVLLLTASQDERLLDLMGELMPEDLAMLREFVRQAQFPFEVYVGHDR
ncbi:hypothetical protein SAMN04490248_12918 [Salinihabitans flavidus]|uniref:Uncharacterized protein n=1 Tax=Salinihabitans flavidus TaxID=569882 RepID=A0A1H8VH33_9RHOB|nr:hypothetical protein [Salinihabitans flavidus]SEP14613.1 hypothetical protein SAMN04490248_12918 [Salinihabitans flavidus]